MPISTKEIILFKVYTKNLFQLIIMIFDIIKKVLPSCFQPKDDMSLNQELYNVSKKYKISILPIQNGFNLENLYPLTDRVHLWNIFIVGKDKTYILASCKNLKIPNVEHLPNKTADGIMPDELKNFFDPIWDKTLQGNQLQFYIVFDGQTYFVNTYPFLNEKKRVIGAIMFLRLFETMPDIYYQNEIPIN
jgi:hypothetical protein